MRPTASGRLSKALPVTGTTADGGLHGGSPTFTSSICSGIPTDSISSVLGNGRDSGRLGIRPLARRLALVQESRHGR